MLPDDCYADPTFFDRCQARIATLAEQCHRRLEPYLWGLAFHAFALACYLALAIIVSDFAVAGTSLAGVAGVRSLATMIGVAMALSGGIHFQRAARQAWPAATVAVTPVLARSRGRTERRGDPVRREQARVFLDAVRASGVNVKIARALFLAGIRSTDKLGRTSDDALLAIPGVGPATVLRLRRRFGAPPTN